MRRPLVKDERYPLFDRLVFAVFVLFVPVALGGGTKTFGDGDVSWHIAAGRWILANQSVPATDPFSFTLGGQPWVAFEWLSQIIYAAAFNLAGYRGVAMVVILAIIGLHFILFAFLRRRVGPIAMVVTFVAMDVVLTTFVLARPHVLVWPVLAAWTALLLRCRDTGHAPPLALAGLMLVWANLHGSFMLGLVIAGAVALDALIAAQWSRRVLFGWLNFGLAALIAALLNANGIAGFLHPINVMGLENLAFIQEWQASTPSTTPLFYAIFLLTLGALLFRGVKFAPGELLLLLFLSALAFSQVRHQSWLAIVAPLILAPRLAARRHEGAAQLFRTANDRRIWIAAGAVAGLAILSARLLLPLGPSEGRANPRTLIANIPEDLRSKPVFNEYSFGGPLILAGIRPYIDGRSDMYGDAFVSDYVRIADGDLARFDRAVRQYGIAWTMLPPDLPLARALDASPAWRRTYVDRIGVIHVRRTALPGSNVQGSVEGGGSRQWISVGHARH